MTLSREESFTLWAVPRTSGEAAPRLPRRGSRIGRTLPCIKGVRALVPRDSHPKSSPLLVPGGSLLPIGRVEVRTDPRKYRHKLRGGETRPRSPNFSPTSHHRGGYSTAWTVADRRMHLQDPLGHKRLQTFPCEESRGRTSEGAGRAQVGPGTRARFRGAVRVKARFPPTTTMNTRLRPTSEPSARPRGSPYPRGRRGDLQSSETQDPVSAPP